LFTQDVSVNTTTTTSGGSGGGGGGMAWTEDVFT